MTEKVCKIQIVALVKKKWRFHVQSLVSKRGARGHNRVFIWSHFEKSAEEKALDGPVQRRGLVPPSFFMYLVIIPPFWERILSKYWCGLFLNKKWMRRCRDRSLQNSIARLYNNLSWLLSMAKTTSNIIILMHALHIKHIKQNIIHMYLYIHRHIPAWNFKGG